MPCSLSHWQGLQQPWVSNHLMLCFLAGGAELDVVLDSFLHALPCKVATQTMVCSSLPGMTAKSTVMDRCHYTATELRVRANRDLAILANESILHQKFLHCWVSGLNLLKHI
jgi:hypothetical protein